MHFIGIDFEGVLVPEIWQSLAKKTNIKELELTTKDIPNYQDLMKNRIKVLKEENIKEVKIMNINYNNKKKFSKISSNSSKYITSCFNLALRLIGNNEKTALINGPISKKHFLKKKCAGVTEYIANKTNSKKEVMLIYNEKLSVSPITTHIPLK